MVGLPFIADQHKNVKKIERWGMGIELSLPTITSDKLAKTIVEVATNPR